MPVPPSADQVKDSLKRLRRGHGLARPTTLLTTIDESVQAYLARGYEFEPRSAGHVECLTRVLRRTIEQLSDSERVYVEVDFNLRPDHRFSTLTDRQESLAQQLKCAVKTVRRRSDHALETLTYLLLTGSSALIDPPQLAAPAVRGASEPSAEESMDRFWGLNRGGGVDIVCSEIPPDERPEYASPHDRNYLRYAKFADLDTLIFVRTRLAQLAPDVVIRDFAPSEYFGTHADVLVVIGGPPWNAKYREFLPQVPFRFDSRPLGEDDPLIVPDLDNLILAPRWTPGGELIEDLAVLTRITVQGTTVFLLGGCLTLGVLGAARCLLDAGRGSTNAGYITERAGDDDFVVVTETRRVGGLTDVADLAVVEPLLLMARPYGDHWKVVVDNTERFTRQRKHSSRPAS